MSSSIYLKTADDEGVIPVCWLALIYRIQENTHRRVFVSDKQPSSGFEINDIVNIVCSTGAVQRVSWGRKTCRVPATEVMSALKLHH